MTPCEVVRHCKAVADHRRRDVIERSWLTGSYTGLAFVGKLEPLQKYLPSDREQSEQYSDEIS